MTSGPTGFPSFAPNSSKLPHPVELKGYRRWLAIAGFSCGVALGLLGVGLSFKTSPPIALNAKTALAIAYLATALFCGLRLWLFRWPALVLYPDRVEHLRLTGWRTLSRTDVAGVGSDVSDQFGSHFEIVTKPGCGDSIRLDAALRKDPVFAEWLAGAPDPKIEALKADKAALAADGRYGATSSEREARLRAARAWVVGISILCLAVAVWAGFFAKLDLTAIGVAAICAALGVALVQRAEGLIVWLPKGTARPTALATLAPAVALIIRAILTVHLVQPDALFPAAAMAGLAGAGWWLLRGGVSPRRLQTSLFFGAGCAWLAFGAAVLGDVALDRSPRKELVATVLGKYISSGRSTHHYLNLPAWGGHPAAAVSVPAELYDVVEVGSTICIGERAGAVRVVWFDLTACDRPEIRRRDAFIAEGARLLDQARFAQAIEQYDQAVAIDRGSAPAVAGRGLAHAWLSHTAAAEADLTQAYRLDPNQIVTLRARGLLAEQRQRWQEAVAAYSKALDQAPKDSFSLVHRAKANLALKAYPAVLKDLDADLAVNPGHNFARIAKARTYLAMGQPDMARMEATRIDAKSPDPDVQLTRAEILSLGGDTMGARRVLDQSIASKPTVAAYILRSSLGGASARTDAEAALRLEPTSEQALTSLASIELRSGNAGAALALIDRAILTHPDNLLHYFSRTNLLLKLGRGDEREAAYKEIRSRGSSDPTILNNLCWVEALNGVDLGAALNDCDAALRMRPDGAFIQDSRGFVLLRLSRNGEARDAYDLALKAEKLATSYFGRSVAERRLGQAEAADQDLAIAKSLQPDIATRFAGWGVRD